MTTVGVSTGVRVPTREELLGDGQVECHIPTCVLGLGHVGTHVTIAEREAYALRRIEDELMLVITAPHMSLGNLTPRGFADRLRELAFTREILVELAGRRWAEDVRRVARWSAPESAVSFGQADLPFASNSVWSWSQYFAQSVTWRRAGGQLISIGSMHPVHRHNALKYLLAHALKYADAYLDELSGNYPGSADAVSEGDYVTENPQRWIRGTVLFQALVSSVEGGEWYLDAKIPMVPLDTSRGVSDELLEDIVNEMTWD